jgi:hypothetical protein
MKMNSAAEGLLLVVWFSVVTFLSGCVTVLPVDWDSRVGHYTYAEAVNELGPPNRQIRLSNGTTEFKWFSPVPGNFGTGMNNGFGPNQNFNPGFNNRYLLLTFDRNGVLTAWSKNY